MLTWSIISSEKTECHEMFITPGNRGVVLRPVEQEGYSAFVEKEGTSKWSDNLFPQLNEAKAWCEQLLGKSGAPLAGYYIFSRSEENDTPTEICFKRESPPFSRSGAALEAIQTKGFNFENSRLFLMLERVPEKIFEPVDPSVEVMRFKF